MSARQEAAVPASPFVELAKQCEQLKSGGLDTGGDVRDRFTELLDGSGVAI